MAPGIPAPIPNRNPLVAQALALSNERNYPIQRPGSGIDFVSHGQRTRLAGLSRTPDPANMQQIDSAKDEQDDKLLQDRLKAYSLNYPENEKEYREAITDPSSKWYSMKRPRKLILQKMLPYKTETHTDQAKHICHILVHLYIAIKSLDIEGFVHISAKDLANVKNDIELALDTDLFNADMLSFDAEDVDMDEGDEEDEEIKSSGMIGKTLPSSATIVSVNHWTNELRTCLKMKFELPLSLRASLSKVYYAITLTRGQSIKSSMFIDMFVDLVSGYRRCLIDMKLLVLDHMQLLDFFGQFFPDPNSKFDIFNPQTNAADKKTFTEMLKLAIHANPFFEPGAMKEVFDWSLQRYSLSSGYISLQVLSHTIPIRLESENTIVDYIPSIIQFWANAPPNKGGLSENNVIHLLSRAANKCYYDAYNGQTETFGSETFGTLTEDQMKFFMHRVLGNLRQECFQRSNTQISTIMVLSITPQNFDSFYELLKSFMGSLETFIHPSNSGAWTPLIAKFCYRFVLRYHKRIEEEKEEDDCELAEEFKLTDDMNNKIVNLFNDIAFLGSQSKKETNANYYVTTLGHLADIQRGSHSIVMDRILLDLYDSLTDQFVNSTHRLIVSLKQFTEVVRFMVLIPVYRVHITNILTLVVSKIGANDISLTNHTINTFVTVASIIPIQDATTADDFISFESTTLNFIQDHLQFIKEKPGLEFIYDEMELKNAFKASTSQFKYIMGSFIERIYVLVQTDISEKLSFKITQTLLIVTQSLSADIFKHTNKLVHDKLLEGDFNNFNDNETIFANLVAAMVKRDSSLAHMYFKDLDRLIRYEIEQGAGSIRNSDLLSGDMKLVVYLMTISEVVSVANSEILKFQKELIDLLYHLYEKISTPSLSSRIAYILHKALKNLTNVKLEENKLFKEEPSGEECLELWGAYQFDEKRFDEDNLKFDWYVPTLKEIRCAIEIFEKVVLDTLTSIENVMNKNDKILDIGVVDSLIKDLRFICAAVSGTSMLFDPDFTSDSSPIFSRTALEKKLLILRSMRASKTDDHELNIDIEQITSKDEEPEFAPDECIPQVNNDDIPDLTIGHLMDEGFTTYDDDLSSSVMMTPSGVQGEGMEAVMNPAIAFNKQEKIYTCNYFFGSNAAEKNSYFDYGHIHSLRSMIGQSLHKFFLFLTNQKTENPKLFQEFLSTLRAYISDIGKESTYDIDDQLFIDYVFMKKILSAGNHFKPFTRTCFAARAEKFHRQRVILHSTNRFPSKIDILLLSDLVTLSTSTYETTSAPALLVLVDAIRKIIGSYRLIIRSLKERTQEAIKKDDYKSLQAALSVFHLNKVSSKISTDYRSLECLLLLFDRCLKHDNVNVSTLAKALILSITNDIKVPSAVARFDQKAVDSIMPPDKCIDLEVSAVKDAKDKKRAYYIEQLGKLQDFICTLVKEDTHWSYKFLYVSLLSVLQDYYELPTKEETLKIIITQAKGHPSLIRHCIKSFSKIVDKITCFADFGYSLENALGDLHFKRPGMIEIDTSNKFSAAFRSEMSKLGNADFYFDGRISVGWLFWGKSLTCLSPAKSVDLMKFSDSDTQLLKLIGSMVTKEWLSDVLKSVTTHNESKAVFQVSDITLISSVVLLYSLGFTAITYQDMLDILANSYDKDDKASVILSAEIVCGLLVATNDTREKDLKIRDEFLDKFLDSALSLNLTPDTASIWSIVSWWLPARVDFRRIPVFHKKLSSIKEYLDPGSNQAFIQSSRLMFARSYLLNLGWQFQDSDKLLKELVYTQPYQVVRVQVAGLLATFTYCHLSPSYNSCDEFVSANSSGLGLSSVERLVAAVGTTLVDLFEKTEAARLIAQNLSPQEALHSDYYYMVTVLLNFAWEVSSGPLVPLLIHYAADYFIPFLMGVESNREMCKLGNIDIGAFIKSFSIKVICRPDEIPKLIPIATVDYSSVHQLLHQLTFIEGFFSRQLLLLSAGDKLLLLSRIDKLLFHSAVEVRTRASEVLTGIIHNTGDLDSISQFLENYKRILSKRKKKEITNQKMIKLHGATMGLGALVSAFPYASPPPTWMPESVALLAKVSSVSGPPGKSAKDILSNFKKLRSDTWHVDRYSFTEEQLSDLEGVLWSSYFA